MRTIKFKAWDTVLDEMVEWDALANSFASVLYDKNYKVMQFTGLLDKNGKEIYEGDITNEGTVEWCDCLNWDGGGSNHPGFYFKDKYEYGRGGLAYHTGFDEDTEVTGNIYQKEATP
jgi:uncharacterized phage protein (TIGR01671 family)